MYGLVLATALTTSAAAPDLFFRSHSCHGCSGCYGCYGCSGCSGCYGYGCCGGYACYGCYGSSCYGGYGCCGSGCYGCYGTSCHGCCGCYGGYGYTAAYAPPVYYGCYGCSGCYGCCGMPIATPLPSIQVAPPMKSVDEKGMVMEPATVVIKAARDIQIKVNGQLTPRRTIEETFTTPVLTSGKTYSYVITAEQIADGKTRKATKEVTVEAGKKTVVDFTDLDSATVKDEGDSASVTVVLPASSKVFVNDVELAVNGKRTFQTPKLAPGQRYFYTVKIERIKDGKTTTETRRVNVEAGKAVTVDFTADAVLTASR